MEKTGSGYVAKSNQVINRATTKKSNLSKGIRSLKEVSAKAEYDQIVEVLKTVNFNKGKAAELLGIDRKTLYKKLKYKP